MKINKDILKYFVAYKCGVISIEEVMMVLNIKLK